MNPVSDAEIGNTSGELEPIDPTHFIASVVAFEPGSGAGFGQHKIPEIVQGPPQGGGQNYGGLDVLSLGQFGVLTVELGAFVYDGPGYDFIVFENAFEVAGAGGQIYVEPAEISVSDDGVHFTAFPCDEKPPWQGCAGLAPVLTSPGNEIDPRQVETAGGDPFDLSVVGIPRARFVRINDRVGKGSNGQAGFDLDAIVIIHAEHP